MKYVGKVYGRINGKYIECTQAVEQLEKEIERLKLEVDKIKDNVIYSLLLDMRYFNSSDFLNEENKKGLSIAIEQIDRYKFNNLLIREKNEQISSK